MVKKKKNRIKNYGVHNFNFEQKETGSYLYEQLKIRNKIDLLIILIYDLSC